MDFVFQRSLRRVSPLYRSAGRTDAATRDRARSSDALLHAFMVAGLEEARLHGHGFARLGAGRGERQSKDRRKRSVDGAFAHLESRLESGFKVGRVLEPATIALP